MTFTYEWSEVDLTAIEGTGEKKLNSYSVIKGPEWNNPADPS